MKGIYFIKSSQPTVESVQFIHARVFPGKRINSNTLKKKIDL